MTAKTLGKEQTLKLTIEMIKKFGFISRNTIWNHIMPSSRATKFRHWYYLCESRELTFARSTRPEPDHLVLSHEYRKAFPEDCGVRRRSALYYEHDEVSMNFALDGFFKGFFSDFWSEQELKLDPSFGLQILGARSGEKIPDLVFDLNARDHVRVALEIEMTRKSHSRYRHMRMSYNKLKSVHLVLFGVPDKRTEAIISETCESPNFSIGFFTLRDLEEQGLECELRIRSKTFSMNGFFTKLCSREEAPLRQNGDKSEIFVSALSQDSGGSK